MVRLSCVLIAIAAALLAPSVAGAKTYDVPDSLGRSLERVVARSEVGVLVPNRLSLDFSRRVYGSGVASERGYSLGLAGRRRCGANACSLADFSAEVGGEPWGSQEVSLGGGRTGYFQPLSCGASCSPPSIQWVAGGVLYSITARLPNRTDAGARKALTRAARSAIAAGPR
jgi:hypothetical protein